MNKGKHAKQAVPLNFDWTMCPGGFYRFALNGYNKHAYLRCMVCCSCGVDGDTGDACKTGVANITSGEGCGRNCAPGHVNITTGPDAGTYKPGHCGHTCENSKADTVGMVEYDLVTETVIGTHEPTHETNKGNSAPQVSARGDYVSRYPNPAPTPAPNPNPNRSRPRPLSLTLGLPLPLTLTLTTAGRGPHSAAWPH